jgi:5-methyltetrahydropteroyltriglutamate--homocysteine methyltransferase
MSVYSRYGRARRASTAFGVRGDSSAWNRAAIMSTRDLEGTMDLLLANHSSYPRIGDGPGQQRLRRAYAQHERGELSAREFEEIQRAVVEEVIREQVAAGLDVVTDGQIRWYDPISHFAGRLGGVSIDGLLRFFDTNFYVRQPVVVDRLVWVGPVLVEEYRSAQAVSPKPVKATLTGPYTLGRFSIRETTRYRDLPELVADYTEAVMKEVESLAAAGATLIQIEEPAILQHPGDAGLVKVALSRIASRKGSARLLLATYFGDAAPLYEIFQGFPVDVLGFDFTYSPALGDLIGQAGSDKAIAFGLIDGRNTRIDPIEGIVSILRTALPGVKGSPSYLTPSCGLEYLPRDKAQLKLHQLATVRAALAGR